MQALILAGGLGTRMTPLLCDTPKVMARIDGQPFLAILLEQLRGQGVKEICLAVGHLAGMVMEYFSDGSHWDVTLSYSVESRPLGTGGAIKRASERLETEFLVLNGDSYLDVSFQRLVAFHRSKHASLTLALTRCEESNRYGTVRVDANGRIRAFLEKHNGDKAGPINAGVYVLHKEFLAAIPGDVPVSFEREVIPNGLDAPVYGFEVPSFFVDIGTPDSYRRVKNGFPRG